MDPDAALNRLLRLAGLDVGGIFVSTHCNCAHDLCTGEAVDKDHEDCWIHPLALRVEAEFGLDVLYRLTEDREDEICAWFVALLNRDMDDLDIEEVWAEVKARLTEV